MLAALVLLSGSGAAQAQRALRAPLPWTGYELALDGPTDVRMGRSAHYRGVAYRVRGLAGLVPFAGRVRARVDVEEGPSGAWVEVRSGTDGRFEVEVPVPEGIESASVVQVDIGPEDGARSFESPVIPRPGVSLVLRTDRNLYEAGEPVHVWAWLVDEASRRPIAGQTIELSLEGGSMTPGDHEVRTGPSGVAHLELRVPDGVGGGRQNLTATIAGQLTASASFSIGTRTYERILATVEVDPEPVVPGASARVIVTATATSGAPIVGAQVDVRIGTTPYSGTTDAHGVARVAVRAPVHVVHDTGSIVVHVALRHPGHGSLERTGTMRLAVPLSLSIELAARHGGLVPEIDDVLYVRLHDALGEPPAQPTQITVSGPAIRGGRAQATTDANGIAQVPCRLPIGSASGHAGSPETSVLVEVTGPLSRLARVSVPVFRDAEVLPTPSQPVVAPGGRLRVVVDRRPAAARRPVVLELLDAHAEVARVVLLAPGQRNVDLDLPTDRLGLMTLRARAVHADETLEGVGGLAHIIVRPVRPDFVQVAPGWQRWTVGETARVRLTTGAGGPRRWAAVLVRDLAAHGGESPFAHHFLGQRFRQALLEASGEVGDRLVFAALGASSRGGDPPPSLAPPLVDELGLAPSTELAVGRGLRDPWPLARELERRGVARAMRRLESRLVRALRSDGLDALTMTSRGRRSFREDALEASMSTLGGEPMTPALLEASDPSFTYDNVASRVARSRLVRLMLSLAVYLDPGDEASPAARMAAREPWGRWLPRMVERGQINATDLDDPWGHRFVLRSTRTPALVISSRATHLELVSPGPDGRLGTRDDVRDPFARVVPPRTPYALASGEDALMRQLSVLSPVRRTLRRISRSYARVTVEMSEDEIGDAVAAQVSEGTLGLGGLGLAGHGGGGGGSGSGYGRGSGTLGGRRYGSLAARVAAGTSGLAAVVRERFPPTLLFVPSLELDASGTTEIPIALADAVTTFLVEVVVWREDGWSWSANTRFEVDREIVIAAPVPEVAHVGDRISLPVRVANHGDTARELEVRLGGSDALGVDDAPAQRVTVPAGDAVAVQVELAPSRVGEGRIEFAVVTLDGQALDAIRLPMRVVDVARHVTRREQALAAGIATLELDVPEDATAREADVQLAVGASLFGQRSGWSTWTGSSAPIQHQEPIEIAFWVGAAWSNDDVDDDALDSRIDRLTVMLDADVSPSGEAADRRLSLMSWALLGLRQVVGSPRRPQLGRARELVERLRRDVGAGALATSEPGLWALAAAALGWTSSPDDLGRTRELVRRLSRHTVSIGEDRWLALETGAVRGTVLWAMAEIALGHRARAFSILATVSRWADDHPLETAVRVLARAAVERVTRGPAPSHVTLTIDGVEQRVELVGGGARIEARELASPGRHTVTVSAGSGAPIVVRARVSYGVPWSAAPPRRIDLRGPLVLSIEGEVGDLVRRAELVLVARNRTPRTLREPIIEIELPTGTELPPDALRRIGARVVRQGDLLTIHLAPMRPGNERRVPLWFRWSVAGELRGLGISGRTDERPEAVTVVPPRTLMIREAGQ